MILHGHWTANDSSSGSRSSLGDDGRSKLDSRHKLIGHTRRRMYIHTHGGRTHVNERTLRSVRFRDDHSDDATGGDPYTFTRSHRRRTRTDGWCWYGAQARARSFVHDLRVPTRGDVSPEEKRRRRCERRRWRPREALDYRPDICPRKFEFIVASIVRE